MARRVLVASNEINELKSLIPAIHLILLVVVRPDHLYQVLWCCSCSMMSLIYI